MSFTYEEQTYERVTTETVKGLLVTAENVYQIAEHLSEMNNVHSVSVELGGMSGVKVTSSNLVRGRSDAFAPGDIIRISSDGHVTKPYAGKSQGEWKALP